LTDMTKTMVDIDLITEAIDLACRAPSLHNSQPWRWVASSEVVHLFGDPHRVVRSTDSSGREALISCGAVLDHFQVAMAAAGWNTHVDQFPNPNNFEHLASIDFTPLDLVTQAWRDKADAILKRRSDRLPFRAPRNWQWFEPMLRGSFGEALATLHELPDEARPQLMQATRLTETARRYDDTYHRELQWWTAPYREFEGIPQSELVSESEDQRVAVDRKFPVTRYDDRRSATTQDQAKILVLSTRADTRVDAFNSGRVLSTVLLECTMAGLATCTLTHITEMEDSRAIIRDLIGQPTAMPQALIRVGMAPALEATPPPTPRRPLTDVLEIQRR
jgi:nitroreductase